jgi:hypothetical protein
VHDSTNGEIPRTYQAWPSIIGNASVLRQPCPLLPLPKVVLFLSGNTTKAIVNDHSNLELVISSLKPAQEESKGSSPATHTLARARHAHALLSVDRC